MATMIHNNKHTIVFYKMDPHVIFIQPNAYQIIFGISYTLMIAIELKTIGANINVLVPVLKMLIYLILPLLLVKLPLLLLNAMTKMYRMIKIINLLWVVAGNKLLYVLETLMVAVVHHDN